MDFNPRAATGIPTEPVGSIPRPLKLQQAFAAYDAKKITKTQLEEEQNAALPTPLSALRQRDRPSSRTASSESQASRPIQSRTHSRERDWHLIWPPAASISLSLPMATIASCPRLPVVRSNTISTPATS